VGRAPFEWRPSVLDTVKPPNLYTLRGPRRAGKSTVLKQTIARLCDQGVDPRRICYFAGESLKGVRDVQNLFQAARRFFPDLTEPRYFFLDEVTTVPDWQLGLKWLRDNTLWSEDCIVATGSSAADIAAGIGHLAGRRGPDVGLDRLLLPLSFPEFLRCAGFAVPESPRLPLEAFWTAEGLAACQAALPYLDVLAAAFDIYLRVGGFPRAVADFRSTGAVSPGVARDLWDVTEADLRDHGLTRPERCVALLERVVRSLTSRLNVTDVAREIDAARETVGSWLDALANAYLILILFREKGGVSDFNSMRKIYPIDPLIAHLPSSRDGTPQPELSRLAEAVLATTLFRAVEGEAVDRFGSPRRVFYFRHDETEVDFVVLPARHAVESKYVDRITARDTAALKSRYGGGLVLTRGALDLQPGTTVIPAGVFAWLLRQGG
jgi:predicted AAA+ superfamily ATPase